MRTPSRRVQAVLLASLIAGTLTGVRAEPAQAAACDSATSGAATWYPGPSASQRYDAMFAAGPAPVVDAVLSRYVPQGLATWINWDGSGATLLVYSAYAADGSRSVLQGVNANTGARTRYAYVPYSHVGGLAVSNGHVWIAGDGKLSRYGLSALRAAFKGVGPASISPSYSRAVYGSSFLSAYSGHLFAGRFNESARDVMHRYRIEANGTLTLLSGSIEVPAKTQGVAVSTSHLVFSTSYGETNRSALYVVRRNYGLDSARASCFLGPTMSEGATLHNGRVYVIFESGAGKYTAGSDPTNVIKRLHHARLSTLTALVD